MAWRFQGSSVFDGRSAQQRAADAASPKARRWQVFTRQNPFLWVLLYNLAIPPRPSGHTALLCRYEL